MATLNLSMVYIPLQASDDSYYTFPTDVTTSTTFQLGDTPDGFASMDTLSSTVERSVTGANDDTYSLAIRIVSSGTILAAADAAGAFVDLGNVSGATDAVVGPTAFPYVNTSASKAAWDNAVLELQQTYSQSMGADGLAIRVDHVVLDGTYTPLPAPTETPTLTAGQIGTTTVSSLTSTAVTNATEYEFQRDGVTVQNTSSQVFDDTGRTPGTTHTYRVRGVNGSGAGPWSNELTVTTISWAKLRLSDPAGAVDPADPRTLSVRARVTSGTGTLIAKLHEPAGAEEEDSGGLTTAFTTLSLPITMAVVDYANLEVHLSGLVDYGAELQVSHVALEVPGTAPQGAIDGVSAAASGASGGLSRIIELEGDSTAASESSGEVAVATGIAKFGLPSADAPSVDSGHEIVVRAQGSNGVVRVSLAASGTVLESWDVALTPGFATSVLSVDGALISDYSSLELWTQYVGTVKDAEVSQLYLVVPEGAATPGQLSGEAPAASAAAAELGLTRPFDGAATAASAAEADVRVARPLDGAATAASAAAGSAERHRALEASAGAASAATGALTTVASGATELSGTAAAASAATAAADVTRGLTASAPAAGAADGDLVRLRGLGAAAPAAAAAEGDISARLSLAADAGTAADADADLRRQRRLDADASAASASSGSLDVVTPGAVSLSGAAPSASSASGDPARRRGVTGDARAASAASATLVVVAAGKQGLEGAASTASGVTALLRVQRALGGDGASTSGAAAELTRIVGLSGSAAAASSAKIHNDLDTRRLCEIVLQGLDLRMAARSVEPVMEVRLAELLVASPDLTVSSRPTDAATNIRTGQQPTRSPSDLVMSGSGREPRQDVRLGLQTVEGVRLRITARAADLDIRPETMEMV